MKHAQHLGLAHPHHLAVGHGLGGRQAKRLADQAALAEEVARPQDADHRLLALLGGDDDLDLALADVEHRVGHSGLPEDHFLAAQVRHGVPVIDGGEKRLGIEGGLGFPGHGCPCDDA